MHPDVSPGLLRIWEGGHKQHRCRIGPKYSITIFGRKKYQASSLRHVFHRQYVIPRKRPKSEQYTTPKAAFTQPMSSGPGLLPLMNVDLDTRVPPVTLRSGIKRTWLHRGGLGSAGADAVPWLDRRGPSRVGRGTKKIPPGAGHRLRPPL